MAYVALVRDIRFCQNTYLKPRIGAKLLKAVIQIANGEYSEAAPSDESSSSSGSSSDEGSSDSSEDSDSSDSDTIDYSVYEELTSLLRTALAFYVESRRTELAPVKEKLARRDSMTDAQQAMAAACDYIEENLDALGEPAIDTPIYNMVQQCKRQEERDKACACAAEARRRRKVCNQNGNKLFTAFPMTHRGTEHI